MSEQTDLLARIDERTAAIASRLDEMFDRMDRLDKIVVTGNGKPALTERMSLLEQQFASDQPSGRSASEKVKVPASVGVPLRRVSTLPVTGFGVTGPNASPSGNLPTVTTIVRGGWVKLGRKPSSPVGVETIVTEYDR